MKQFSFCLSALFLFSYSFSQTHTGSTRSQLDPAKFPFYHGVASGDPLANNVILWTRITLNPPVDPVTVYWEIAYDTGFVNIANSGSTTTDSTKDYTVKIDAGNLQAGAWYYYRFRYDTFYSVTGRTRTLPVGSVNNLRFAVASCQDYQDGYYNAHKHISQRNDIDAVIFLGDYTYEGGANATVVGDRYHEPGSKTIQLADYRIRESLYHLDPDLQEAHRQFPWINVWDDHETANNSFKDGAKNHNPGTDGDWYERKVNGVETYEEWIPIRKPDVNDTFRIFRNFTWGNLADLHMIDSRLYGRDKQVTTSQFVSITDSLILDSTRNMLGPVQFDWLNHSLDSSTAQWQIIGNQVIMTPMIIPAGFQPTPVMINSDQWDGYPFDRQKFYDHITQNNIQNVVVLTGDIHTSWANDLPLNGYDASHRDSSAGVEFVAPSITSGNELPQIITPATIYSLAPHVRYVDLTQHGYYLLDVRPAKTQCDFVYVDNVTSQTFTTGVGPSWCVNAGERYLQNCLTPSTAMNMYPAHAPGNELNTSVTNLNQDITAVSIRPNPFYDEVLIQFNCLKTEKITLEVWSADGKLMLKENLGTVDAGLRFAKFDGSKFPSGFYLVKLNGQNSSKGETVIKIN